MCLKGYTNFHDSLGTYLQRFNISDHSKLAIWIDDIFGSSLKDTRRIFPKVTSSTQQYERKGETMLTLDEFSNLWITSNENTPLHIKPTDRRQLIFKVSENKLRDRVFFGKCAEECENLDIAYAWFEFLKHRDLSNFSPDSDPDTILKGQTIASCMVKSHIFIRKFFLEEWYCAYNKELNPEVWCEPYAIGINSKNPHKDKIRVRISQKRLYKLYQCFVREFFPQSRCRNSDTFWEELTELGLVRFEKRRCIKERKFYVVDIYFHIFQEHMKQLYPGIVINTWLHIENYKQFLGDFEHYRTR